MASNDYHFITRWRVRATPPEIADVFGDAAGLARWWPSVYLDVEELAPGDPQTGMGKQIGLNTKGWLPYTLRWEFEVSEVRRDGFTLVARGDFEGRGIWTFEQAGPDVLITYDWKIQARKPILRRLSFLLKPIFAANHRWAMRQGEESLKLELERRRAATEGQRARLPPPPGPTTVPALPLVAGTAAVAAVLYLAVRRIGRRQTHGMAAPS